MKHSLLKNILLAIFAFHLCYMAAAQLNKEKTKDNTGINHLVSTGVLFPIGNFSTSHVAGTGISYNHSNKRFGWLNNKPGKPVAFTFGGGLDYFLAKKDKTSPAPGFTFKNLLCLHTEAGAIVNAGKRTAFNLSAGPLAELYAGNLSGGFRSNFIAYYFINKKIAVAPSVSFMKKSKAAMLWTTGVFVSYSLK